jgi:hypothetical protein
VDAVSGESFHVELEVSPQALGEALSTLKPEQLVQVLSIADDHSQDWETVCVVRKWVLPRHRELAQEVADEEAEARGHCVRSSDYKDIWGHTIPHIKCILR